MICDVLIVGAGPAGLAAAITAGKEMQRVVIVSRGDLGGILCQCIHTGFGVEYFNEDLTGPEYATKFTQELSVYPNIKVLYGTVTKITPDKVAEIVTEDGYFELHSKAVILATGCRERPRGALEIAGTRPSGVWTAGAAQRLINIEGKKIGNKVLILGSGDIGLIMARRLTFEGSRVVSVLEIKPELSGSARNIKQCLTDYNINYEVSTTIVEVRGKSRIEGVITAKVDSKYNIIAGSEKYVKCDALLLAVGLIPENDLVPFLKADRRTGGLAIDTLGGTSMAGFYACGNCAHIHDVVDNVSSQGEVAGHNAAMFAQGLADSKIRYQINCGKNVAFVVPQIIVQAASRATLYIKPQRKLTNVQISIMQGSVLVKSETRQAVSPKEIIKLSVPCQSLSADLTVYIGERQ